MKRIITTDILDPSIQQPITGNSMDFLQDGTKEITVALAKSLIGNSYDVAIPYVIHGLLPYGTNQYQEGYVLFNNEIYFSAGKVSVTAFVNVPVMTITLTNDATADPVVFTDGLPYNVHKNRTLVLSDAASGSGTFDLSTAVYVNRLITAATPTTVAYDLALAVVVGGVTFTTKTSRYTKTATGFKMYFTATGAATLATTAYIAIQLPFSLPTIPVSTALGHGACKFFKTGTGGVPTFVSVAINSGGTGWELTIEKADGTAFGALTGYDVNFTIDIIVAQ